MSKELEIINKQIQHLSDKQEAEELTFDDIRQLDLLVKNKLLIKQVKDSDDFEEEEEQPEKESTLKELRFGKVT